MIKTATPIVTFFLILFTSFTSLSQDYRLFYPGQEHFFRSGDLNYDASTHVWTNLYSWSKIKSTAFDTSFTNGTALEIYPFRTWRDTTQSAGLAVCGLKEGPSWMGSYIKEENGETRLLNEQGDTVLVIQSAPLGAQWNFLQLSGGWKVRAQVDSIYIQTVAGITDSVKQIRLSVLDNLSNPVTTHVLSGARIQVSKSNGIFKAMSFRDLPGLGVIDRITSVPAPTYADMFDFSIGDQFEYKGQCSSPSGPPGFTYIRIVDKWYNPDSSEVYYQRSKIQLGLTFNPFPTPHLDSTLVYTSDTVSYLSSVTPVYQNVSEQNGMQMFLSPHSFGVFLLEKDSLIFNNRPIYSESSGYMMDDVSCLYFNHFEPTYIEEKYVPGLGIIRHAEDYRSQAGTFCEYDLIWYQKGSETWGQYLDLNTIGAELLSASVAVYPNPVKEQCVLRTADRSFKQAEIISMTGALMAIKNINSSTTTIDMKDFPSGLYLFRLTDEYGRQMSVRVLKERD